MPKKKTRTAHLKSPKRAPLAALVNARLDLVINHLGDTSRFLAVLSAEMGSFVNHLVATEGPARAAEKERADERELVFFRTLHRLNPHDSEGWKTLTALPLQPLYEPRKPRGEQFEPDTKLPPQFKIGTLPAPVIERAVDEFKEGVRGKSRHSSRT